MELVFRTQRLGYQKMKSRRYWFSHWSIRLSLQIECCKKSNNFRSYIGKCRNCSIRRPRLLLSVQSWWETGCLWGFLWSWQILGSFGAGHTYSTVGILLSLSLILFLPLQVSFSVRDSSKSRDFSVCLITNSTWFKSICLRLWKGWDWILTN